jgi:flagellar biogenesis protein FliO
MLIACSSPAAAQTPPPPPAVTASASADAMLEADRAEEARLEAEKRKLEEALDGPGPATRPGYLWQLVQTFFFLIVVCLLAYLVLGKGLPKLLSLSPGAARGMMAAPPRGVVEVIDRLPLDPRRALLVVRVGGSHFLIGVSEQGMSMLARLDESQLGAIQDLPAGSASLWSKFQGLLGQKIDKEGT